MVFREVTVVQIKEALRRWLLGEGERPIAHGVGVDRKTARRYIAAAVELGIDRLGGEGQLSDELIGQVAEKAPSSLEVGSCRCHVCAGKATGTSHVPSSAPLRVA